MSKRSARHATFVIECYSKASPSRVFDAFRVPRCRESRTGHALAAYQAQRVARRACRNLTI